MIFFTSDLHLNHTNIIKYCNRPFNDVDHMNQTLIHNWNQVVSNKDEVYVLGDFCMGQPHQWSGLVNQLNGTIHLILGNHDIRDYYMGMNRIKMRSVEKWQYLEDNGHRYLLNHYPTGGFYPKNQTEPEHYDIALCGHVHEKWLVKEINGKPCVNIGVDQWDFTPVSMHRLNDFLKERNWI